MDDPVHEELGRPSHHQVLFLAGDKVAVDRKFHRGGGVSLSVHGVHRGGETSASDKTGNMTYTQLIWLLAEYMNKLRI